MKNPFLACAVLLGAAVCLQATPVCPMTGTYATLESFGTGGCAIPGAGGDLVYSDFTVMPSSDASSINYMLDPHANGFDFETADFFVIGSGSNAFDLGYDVTSLGAPITGAHLSQTPNPGFGIASIGELLCLGSAISTCPTGSTQFLTTISSPFINNLTDSVTFSGESTIGVSKAVSVFGIGSDGFASLSAFTDTIDQGSAVPEPGFYGVLAGGLGAVLMFARRRKKTP